MCKKPSGTEEPTIAMFHKGNEPVPLGLHVLVSPCKCGAGYVARSRGSNVYVEAYIMTIQE